MCHFSQYPSLPLAALCHSRPDEWKMHCYTYVPNAINCVGASRSYLFITHYALLLMAKHSLVKLGKNKDGPYRIRVHQYSYLKSKQTTILKIFIKNFKGFRNVRKGIETSGDVSVLLTHHISLRIRSPKSLAEWS